MNIVDYYLWGGAEGPIKVCTQQGGPKCRNVDLWIFELILPSLKNKDLGFWVLRQPSSGNKTRGTASNDDEVENLSSSHFLQVMFVN